MRIGRTLPPAAAPIALAEILSGVAGIFSGGSALARFEEELKAYYGVQHAFLLSSGKAALTVILLALKELFPDRDEVLIPGYTCYSVPAAIVKAGLKVRVCDIDPGTLDYQWEGVEKELGSERLLCVVSTHLFGLIADVDRLRKLSSARGVPIVEDAAQAMGGEVDGRKVGTLGDIALFSLGRGKALSTVSGGIIITGDAGFGRAVGRAIEKLPAPRLLEEMKTCCYALALCLLTNPRWYWLPKALPFLGLGETVFDPSFELKKLGGFQSGVAKGWIEKLARLRGGRLRKAEVLRRAGGMALVASAGTVPNLIKFPFVIAEPGIRSRTLKRSEELGLGISPVYPEAVASIPELKGSVLGSGTPQAESIAKGVVSLPVHPFVAVTDLERAVKLLQEEGLLPVSPQVASGSVIQQSPARVV